MLLPQPTWQILTPHGDIVGGSEGGGKFWPLMKIKMMIMMMVMMMMMMMMIMTIVSVEQRPGWGEIV